MPIIFFLAMRGMNGDSPPVMDNFSIPATSMMAVVFGTTMNLAISMVYLREYIMLIRYQITPLTNFGVVFPKLIAAAIISTLSVVLLVTLEWVAFSNPPNFPAIAVFFLVLVVISFIYGIIGVAMSLLLPNENSASPILSIVMIPLLMISGVFVPAEIMGLPKWLDVVANIMPFRSSQQLLEVVYAREPIENWPLKTFLILGAWLLTALLALKFGNLTQPRNRR